MFENFLAKLKPKKTGPERFLKKETAEGPLYQVNSYEERQQLDRALNDKFADEARKENSK